MKNFIRAFALSLVVTGAFASAHIKSASTEPIVAKVSALPTPMCPPNDPNACHIDQGN